MPEEVTDPPQVTLTDELQRTCTGKLQAKSMDVTASPLMDGLQRPRSGRVVKPPTRYRDENHSEKNERGGNVEYLYVELCVRN